MTKTFVNRMQGGGWKVSSITPDETTSCDMLAISSDKIYEFNYNVSTSPTCFMTSIQQRHKLSDVMFGIADSSVVTKIYTFPFQNEGILSTTVGGAYPAIWRNSSYYLITPTGGANVSMQYGFGPFLMNDPATITTPGTTPRIYRMYKPSFITQGSGSGFGSAVNAPIKFSSLFGEGVRSLSYETESVSDGTPVPTHTYATPWKGSCDGYYFQLGIDMGYGYTRLQNGVKSIQSDFGSPANHKQIAICFVCENFDQTRLGSIGGATAVILRTSYPTINHTAYTVNYDVNLAIEIGTTKTLLKHLINITRGYSPTHFRYGATDYDTLVSNGAVLHQMYASAASPLRVFSIREYIYLDYAISLGSRPVAVATWNYSTTQVAILHEVVEGDTQTGNITNAYPRTGAMILKITGDTPDVLWEQHFTDGTVYSPYSTNWMYFPGYGAGPMTPASLVIFNNATPGTGFISATYDTTTETGRINCLSAHRIEYDIVESGEVKEYSRFVLLAGSGGVFYVDSLRDENFSGVRYMTRIPLKVQLSDGSITDIAAADYAGMLDITGKGTFMKDLVLAGATIKEYFFN